MMNLLSSAKQFHPLRKPAFFSRTFSILLLSLFSFAQAHAQTQFQAVFADSGFDLSAYDVHEVSNGYVLCSEVPNIMVTQSYTHLIKTDLSGNLVWQKKFEGSWCNFKPVSTGGFIMVGTTIAGTSVVYKLDNNGVIVWSKIFTAGAGMILSYVIETQDAGSQAFLFVGSYFRQFVGGSTGSDFLAIKTDNTGSILWARCYGRNTFTIGNNLYDYGATAIEVSSGTTGDPDYLIVGKTDGYNTSSADNLYVVKVDGTLGIKTFDKLYVPLYPPGDPRRVGYVNLGRSIAEDNSGNYAICGRTDNITTIDGTGAIQWCKNYSSCLFNNIVKDVNNTGYGAGVSYSSGIETVLLKTGFNGAVSWAKNYDGVSSYVTATSDYGYLVGAGVSVSNVSRYGYLLAKTNASGQSGCYETSESVSATDVPAQVINLGGDDVDVASDISAATGLGGVSPCLQTYSRNCTTPTTFTYVSGGAFSYSVTENNYPFPPFLSNYNITGASGSWNTTYDTKWTLIDAGPTYTNVTEVTPYQYFSQAQPGFANFINTPVRTDKTLCVDVIRKSDGCGVRQCGGRNPAYGYNFRTSEENTDGQTTDNPTNASWNDIQLSPNPASGSVLITMPQQAGGTIEIMDGNGRVVKTLHNVSVSELVDISTLQSGLYLVRVSYSGGVKVSKLEVY
ncbi:MAG: lipoprotein [Chitinophagaceae bacterium]|nr:lipoprotein [Chitinophagaceae bacterium]